MIYFEINPEISLCIQLNKLLFHFLKRCWLMKWIFLNLPFSLLTGKPGSPVMNEGSFSRFCCKNKNKNKKLFYNAWPQKKQLLGQKIDFKIFNPLFCLSATIRQKKSFFFQFLFPLQNFDKLVLISWEIQVLRFHSTNKKIWMNIFYTNFYWMIPDLTGLLNY